MVIQPPKRKKAGCAQASPDDQSKRMRWAELLKRTFLIDVLECHRCGGRRELIAVIKDGNTVTKILDHVGITSTAPSFHPARAPPCPSPQNPPSPERIAPKLAHHVHRTHTGGHGWDVSA